MSRRRRLLCGAALAASLAFCGLAVGTWIGGRWFVPAGSGLAGPAIALAYGVLGAAVGVAAGAGLALRLGARALRWTTAPATLLGLVVVGVLVAGYLRSRAESQAHLEQAYRALPPFRLTLVYAEQMPARRYARAEFDSAADRVTVTGLDGDRCHAALPGRERVALLGALRGVETLAQNPGGGCAGPGPAVTALSFHIDEAKPPATAGELTVSAACLVDNGPVRAALEAIERVVDAAYSRCDG